MRQSVGDIIAGMRTQADIANIESETATREAELPYVGDRARAALDLLRAQGRLVGEQATDISATRPSRINQINAEIGLISQQIAESRDLTPARVQELQANRAKLEAERDQIVAEGTLVPIELGGQIIQVPARIGLPIINEQIRQDEADRRHRETQSRLREQFRLSREDRARTQAAIEQDREERRAAANEKTDEQIQQRVAVSEGVIHSQVTPSGAYRLEPGAMLTHIDAFNRNAMTPYLYMERDKPMSTRTWNERNLKGKIPEVKKVIIPSLPGVGQMNAHEVYKLFVKSQMPTMYEFLVDLYSDYGLNVEDYIAPMFSR
jgi:hypothetical protein